MQQEQIHNFLEQFFMANYCQILEKSANHLVVKLTVELDKKLMNRPFYWHYLEKTGKKPETATLTFITNPKKRSTRNGEIIHFGSPRLHKIFQTTKELGAFVRLYENVAGTYRSTPLYPWLCLNVKISFQCDHKKDFLLSLGLSLIHGQIVPDFFSELKKKNFTTTIPDYCFTLSPLIKPKSGLLRLEKIIREFIAVQNHRWAEEAIKRWEKDLALLESFYEGSDEKPESYEIEKEALKNQYEPKIIVEVINGGLFYLQQNFIT